MDKSELAGVCWGGSDELEGCCAHHSTRKPAENVHRLRSGDCRECQGMQSRMKMEFRRAITDCSSQHMHSFRASEDYLSKRVTETLRIILEALQNRSNGDAKQLKQDLRPLELYVSIDLHHMDSSLSCFASESWKTSHSLLASKRRKTAFSDSKTRRTTSRKSFSTIPTSMTVFGN